MKGTSEYQGTFFTSHFLNINDVLWALKGQIAQILKPLLGKKVLPRDLTVNKSPFFLSLMLPVFYICILKETQSGDVDPVWIPEGSARPTMSHLFSPQYRP